MYGRPLVVPLVRARTREDKWPTVHLFLHPNPDTHLFLHLNPDAHLILHPNPDTPNPTPESLISQLLIPCSQQNQTRIPNLSIPSWQLTPPQSRRDCNAFGRRKACRCNLPTTANASCCISEVRLRTLLASLSISSQTKVRGIRSESRFWVFGV